eukprot:760090_1
MSFRIPPRNFRRPIGYISKITNGSISHDEYQKETTWNQFLKDPYKSTSKYAWKWSKKTLHFSTKCYVLRAEIEEQNAEEIEEKVAEKPLLLDRNKINRYKRKYGFISNGWNVSTMYSIPDV